MTPPDLHRLLIQPLHETGIEYAITGAVAAIAYGEPRMTNDVDLIARLDRDAPSRLIHRFDASEYYLPPEEVIVEESRRGAGGHFNILHVPTSLRADIYLAGEDPLHEWALEHRRSERIGNDSIWLAPIEYVIIRKLEFFAQSGSDRHLRDVAAMHRISGDEIDRAFLGPALAERRLTDLWTRVISA